MGRQYYIDPNTSQKVYLPDYLPIIDKTLTQPNQAAEAKAVGDKFEEVETLATLRQQGQFDNNTLITNINNFVTGTNNIVGSKAFEILGYEAESPKTPISSRGWYTLKNTDDNGNQIYTSENLPTQIIGKYYSVKVGFNVEHISTIESLSLLGDTIKIFVSKIFTNDQYPGTSETDTPYAARTRENRLIFNTYNMAYAITNYETVTRDDLLLWIEGAQEVGNFDAKYNAISHGINNQVQGDDGFATGRENIVSGKYGSAQGRQNIVSYDSHAYGRENSITSVADSMAIGLHNIIKDERNHEAFEEQFTSSVALGERNTIQGGWSTAIGYGNVIDGSSSVGIGSGIKVTGDNKIFIGRYNENNNNNTFEFGNGTNNNNRSNKLEISNNGDVIINSPRIYTDIGQDILKNTPEPAIVYPRSGGNFPITITSALVYQNYCGSSPIFKNKNIMTVMKIKINSYNENNGVTIFRYCTVNGADHFDGGSTLKELGIPDGVSNYTTYIATIWEPYMLQTSSWDNFGFGFKGSGTAGTSFDVLSIKAYTMEEIPNNINISGNSWQFTTKKIAAKQDFINDSNKINYFIAGLGNLLPGSKSIGTTISGSIANKIKITNGNISSLLDPINSSDAVTKAYVDSQKVEFNFNPNTLGNDVMGYPYAYNSKGEYVFISDISSIYTSDKYIDIQADNHSVTIPKGARFNILLGGGISIIKTTEFNSMNTDDNNIFYVYWSGADENWHIKTI